MSDDMVEAIDSFTSLYAATVVEYLRGVFDPMIANAASLLTDTVPRDRSTVYIFGSGGAHAIARQMARSLRERFAGVCGVRVSSGVDFHESQSTALRAGYRSVFEGVLESERADGRDLVVLLSGGGDAEGVLRAARHCRARGIPTISIAGMDGGRITREGLTDHPIVVGIHDHQMSEDVMQILGHVLVETAYRDHVEGGASLERCLDEHTSRIERALARVDAVVLDRVSSRVGAAFLSDRAVFLLAPEGGALGIAAEHAAHVLNWDTVLQLRRPPRRMVHSTPTACDYSGIANDRMMPGVVTCQQLDRALPGDVLLLYAADLRSEPARNTLRAASAAGVEVMALAGHASIPPAVHAIVFGSVDPDILADVGQVTAHILGRLIRLKIERAAGDLAQWRSIDLVAGM
jgi:phosphoheptose isomerase